MHQLATFTTTDQQGKDVLIRSYDGSVVAREHPDGSTLANGLVVAMTPAAMYTAINTQWLAYLTALGDPV
jgi:glutamine synthetase type III